MPGSSARVAAPLLRRLVGLAALFAALFAASPPASAQVKVIISGGFTAAYRELLPQFEKETGMTVTTTSGGSVGNGPNTIGGQIRRGVPADVVILAREGLRDLIAEGRTVPGTDRDLGRSIIGMVVRAGAPKPDISTVERFKQALLAAKTVAVPGSTGGLYLLNEVLPRLGIADKLTIRVTARGSESAELVASGEANLAIQPASELLHVAGVEFVGPLPLGVQLVQVFAGGVVVGSKNARMAKQLIAFLASDRASTALSANGMERPPAR